MINVVGLPLEEALRILKAEGAPEAEIERVASPADFKRRGPEDTRDKVEFVAARMELPGEGIRLRVVSVPGKPKA
jgi:hypothetical protein